MTDFQYESKTAGEVLSQGWRKLTGAIRELVVGLYVKVWDNKAKLREYARVVALVIIGVFTLSALFDVIVEFGLHSALHNLMSSYVETRWLVAGLFVVKARWLILAVFALAILALLAHTIREVAVRKTEYAIPSLLWLLFASRQEFSTESALVKFLLPKLATAFKRLSASGVCIWVRQSQTSEALHVPDGFKFPEHERILDRLPEGRGVASIAFDKVQPCYVPRMYVPFNSASLSEVPVLRCFAKLFPHALRFDSGIRPSTGEFDLTQIFVELDALIPFEGVRFGPFRSIIAVPLVAQQTREVYGVLCMHFRRTNAIDRLDVKAISIIANFIANEILRIRSQNTPATGAAGGGVRAS